MDLPTLRRVLTAFADSPADLDVSKGTLLIQMSNEVIEAKVVTRQGSLHVQENGQELPVTAWLFARVARLPSLADRILDYLPAEPHFVTPRGQLLDQLDDAPDDQQLPAENAAEAALAFLGRRPGGTASVLYLTSDAGEGKTTLIQYLAREQARRYRAKEQDWLLVPVSLGGRTFMRFDDVIAGTLLNRLRFPFLYYNAFLELVRLGALVPAFDGFEEMFVEGSAGDAISALGNLVQAMQSSGSVLIAARKAYFEYKDLQSQTRLFDSLGGQSVSFGRLALDRWDRGKFLEYAGHRGVANREAVYDEVAAKLTPAHPLLTRAVLVKRLLDVAAGDEDRKRLLGGIAADPNDYFRHFIGTIIRREAGEKWIDKLGEVAKPLITEEDHYELLAAVALEMWQGGAESLRADVLDTVAELFADAKRKGKVVTDQVIVRVKQHALIVRAEGNRFTFDHQEFYHFFLGEAVGKLLAAGTRAEIAHTLRQGVFPQLSAETAARHLHRASTPVTAVVQLVNDVCAGEPRASFARDNLSAIVIRLLEGTVAPGVIVRGCSFPAEALAGRTLSRVDFHDCYFQGSSLKGARLTECRFVGTEFERLDLYPAVARATVLDQCTCRSAVPVNAENTVFSPEQVATALEQAGFVFAAPTPAPAVNSTVAEPEMTLVDRLLRAFLRATGVNENTLHKRFGAQAPQLFADVLPRLLEAGVVMEMPYKGAGHQKRFRLGVSLDRLTRAVEAAGGRFDRFIEIARG